MQLHLHVVDIANRAVPTEPFRITLPAEIFEHLQQKFFARVTAAREVISLILDAHYPTLILLYAVCLSLPTYTHEHPRL